MVETDGGGAVIFDYDGDGDPDLFLADGAPLPGYSGETPRSRLFRNDGGGRFVDVTADARLETGAYVSGGVAGDLDGDGDLDLYLTAFGPNLLFENLGDGRFREVGAAAGVDDPLWGSSAALADVDRDGDLDLYVTNYVDFTLDHNIPCGDPERGLRGYCGPDVYDGEPDRFYRNLGPDAGGHPRFEDATASAGLGGADGAGLAVAFGDLDGDGWQDLYVANDLTPNFLFRNRGVEGGGGEEGGTGVEGVDVDGWAGFEDLSLLSGTAYGPRGLPEAGMGIALDDLDADGRLDVAVTNYEGETNALYRNRGGLLFDDRRFTSGLAEATLRQLAFGVAAADLDHDGDLDLVFANGHVRENAEAFRSSSRYRQPNQLFENLGVGDGGARFREVAEPGFDHVGASRGLAAGDLDGDGDLDLVFTNVADTVEVYENLLPAGAGSFLLVDLRRPGGLNSHGVGARLELTADGDGDGEEGGTLEAVREVRAGGSYMSHHDLTVHFGVGGAERIGRLTVRWPEGKVQILRHLPVDRRLLIRPGWTSGVDAVQ